MNSNNNYHKGIENITTNTCALCWLNNALKTIYCADAAAAAGVSINRLKLTIISRSYSPRPCATIAAAETAYRQMLSIHIFLVVFCIYVYVNSVF